MSPKLTLSSAIGYGFDRLATRGGSMLVAAYVLLQLAAQVGVQSLFVEFAPSLTAEQLAQAYPLAVDLPVAVSAGLTALVAVAGIVLNVVAMRALYADVDSVPTAEHTRRLARTVAVTFVVSVVAGLVILVGYAAVVLPGIVLTVCLAFSTLVVAVEDAGVVEALKRSWELTSGNRVRLFFLGFVVVVTSGFVGAFFGIVGVFAPVLGDLLTALVTGVISLYSTAVRVGAYRQLADVDERVPSETVVSA